MLIENNVLFCPTNGPINNEIMKNSIRRKVFIDAFEYSIVAVIPYLFPLALEIEDDNRHKNGVPWAIAACSFFEMIYILYKAQKNLPVFSHFIRKNKLILMEWRI